MGYDRLRKKILNEMETVLGYWNVPSAGYGIVKDGEVFLSGGFGMRDMEKKLPADADTVYMIGSCTKAFTAAVAAKLVDEGRMSWDTPVRKYLPELRFYDEYTTENVTMRDLLCHRTGLPRHEMSWYRTAFTREEIVYNLRYLEPNKPFRTTFQYFNQAYLAAGCIIERISGKPYEECVEEFIFKPLQMNRSSLSKEALENDPNSAKPYKTTVKSDGTCVTQKIDIYRSIAEKSGRSILDPMAPAGGINSTAEDMLKWVQFHLDGGKILGKSLISTENMFQMQTPQILYPKAFNMSPSELPADEPEALCCGYGLGWDTDVYRGHMHVHHSGNIDGFSALTSFVPSLNLGIVLYVNLNSFQGRYDIEHRIIDAFLGINDVNWTKRYEDSAKLQKAEVRKNDYPVLGKHKEGTKPSLSLEAYAGVYKKKGYELLKVINGEDGLLIDFAGLEFSVRHYHYDSFLIKSDHPEFCDEIPIVFHINPQGNVESVAIQFNSESDAQLVLFDKCQ